MSVRRAAWVGGRVNPQVQAQNSTRLKMNADMADSSNLVKTLLVKAEDMRILGDMGAMRRHYKRLHDVNRCAPWRAMGAPLGRVSRGRCCCVGLRRVHRLLMAAVGAGEGVRVQGGPGLSCVCRAAPVA